MFVEVFPNELSIDLSQENKTPSLNLKNITDKCILYKFLINTRGVLIAKPPTSFIKPFQSIPIEIKILNYNLQIEEYKKTKLLIMFIKSDEEIKTVEQAKEKFKKLKKETKEIEKQEILVNLNVVGGVEDSNINQEENENNKNNNLEEKITYVNYRELKNELDSKNNDIKKNLEIQRKKLENLISQENKSNYIGNKGKRKKYYNLDNLIMIFIILIGLIIGANFACGYNKLFKK